VIPNHIDAALAAIRAAKNLITGRKRNDLEQARYQLWSAMRDDRHKDAAAWFRVLEVQMLNLPADVLELVAPAAADIKAHLRE